MVKRSETVDDSRRDLGDLYCWLLTEARSGDKANMFSVVQPAVMGLHRRSSFDGLIAELESSTIQSIEAISGSEVLLVTARAEVQARMRGAPRATDIEGQRIVWVALEGQIWHLCLANGRRLELSALRSAVVRVADL